MSSYRTCPICGASLKLENMSVHMRRIHPRTKADVHVGGDAAGQKRRRGRISNRKLLYVLVATGLVVASIAVYGLALNKTPAGENVEPPARVNAVDVYLQPTCGCCHQYLDYLEMNGYDVTPHEMTDLSGMKENLGIPGDMLSCHTSVIGAYFVEGHVPSDVIQKLIVQRPAIDGISLPGMPAGSPGMGGAKVAPLLIYAIESGQATVFMEV